MALQPLFPSTPALLIIVERQASTNKQKKEDEKKFKFYIFSCLLPY